MRVDDAFAFFFSSILELEKVGVDERLQPGRVGAHRVGVGSVELDQGVQLFDRWQAPVGVAADAAFRGVLEGVVKGRFFAGILRPHQAGYEVGDGAVAVVLVAGWVGGVLRVLAIVGFSRRWKVDGVSVVVGVNLAGVDDGVGYGCCDAGDQGGCDDDVCSHGILLVGIICGLLVLFRPMHREWFPGHGKGRPFLPLEDPCACVLRFDPMRT